MTEALLTLHQVRAGYGREPVLHDIDVDVDSGSILSVLGANGAGKTTTLGAVGGWVRLSHGEVRFDGRPFNKLRADQRVRAGIGIVPEGRQLFPAMTVMEHLTLARAQVRRPREIADVLTLFPVLDARAGQAVGTLSGGEQQMVAIGRALVQRPRALLLDEPSLGLAPLVVRAVLDAIRHIADEGVAVILAEQNARAALRVADKAIVLENGRVALEGAADDLARDTRVRSAYLGENVERSIGHLDSVTGGVDA